VEDDLYDLLNHRKDFIQLSSKETPGLALEISDDLLSRTNVSLTPEYIPSSFILSFGS
jgi:hypothetical protein